MSNSHTSLLDLVWSSYGAVNNSSKEVMISKIVEAWERGGAESLQFNMYDINIDQESRAIAIQHVFDDEEYPDIIYSSIELLVKDLDALENGSIPS